MKPSDLPIGFEDKIYVCKETGCWVWTRYKDPQGYGRKNLNGKTGLVHRQVYTLLVGKIPKGLFLDHQCRNRACCFPGHLKPVTPSENALINSESTSAKYASRKTCPEGHEFSRDLRSGDKGWRKCLQCASMKNKRQYYARIGKEPGASIHNYTPRDRRNEVCI